MPYDSEAEAVTFDNDTKLKLKPRAVQKNSVNLKAMLKLKAAAKSGSKLKQRPEKFMGAGCQCDGQKG